MSAGEDISELLEDPAKQSGGAPVWIRNSIFYVRRVGVKAFLVEKKRLSRLLFGPAHKLTEADELLLIAHLLVEYVVVDWSKVSFKNEPIPYSKAKAREFFLDERFYLTLNNSIYYAAMNYEHFIYENVDEDKKVLIKWLEWDFKNGDGEFDDHVDADLVGEFYESRPKKMDDDLKSVLDAFYHLRRATSSDSHVTVKEKDTDHIMLEHDIVELLIHALDDHYLSLVADEQKKQLGSNLNNQAGEG